MTDATGTTVPGTTTERRSPLDEVHRAAGASFTDFAGWQMPVRYSSDLAEHHAVREHAGIVDLSHMGEILVVGPEAADALDYALAGKLSAIVEGQAKYSLLLGRDGGVIDDLVVYRTGEDRYMVVANASNREVVAEELRNRTRERSPSTSKAPKFSGWTAIFTPGCAAGSLFQSTRFTSSRMTRESSYSRTYLPANTPFKCGKKRWGE